MIRKDQELLADHIAVLPPHDFMTLKPQASSIDLKGFFVKPGHERLCLMAASSTSLDQDHATGLRTPPSAEWSLLLGGTCAPTATPWPLKPPERSLE